MSGPERYEIPPERLGRWLERWAEEHAPVERTEIRPGRVTFAGAEGAVLEADPPFPPLGATGVSEGFDPRRCSAMPRATASWA